MNFVITRESFNTSSVCSLMEVIMWNLSEIVCLREQRCRVLNWYVVSSPSALFKTSIFHQRRLITLIIFQVKATATNVDEAVRELPDANMVSYISSWLLNKDAKVLNAVDV